MSEARSVRQSTRIHERHSHPPQMLPSDLNALSAIKPIALLPLPPTPLVSVLVTCRNYARFVGKGIDSILRQSYTRFEVIVADDGSEDGSQEVVAAISKRDARVRLVAGPHGGMAATLNAAWDVSRGEII